MAYQVQKTDGNSTTWSDPAVPGITIRLKQTSGAKSLDGNPVTNHVTEVILSSQSAVTLAGEQEIDTVSVRLRVSGALESVDHMQDLCSLLANTISSVWENEHWLKGFTPSSVPAPAVV